ncbi:MAG: lytic transglycosylase domain-containing protein [Desulfobulbaceae bacterium]|nr:MAG: lytic transglycosylase domain-containing protein [Desulfobulbaceae bacterium]
MRVCRYTKILFLMLCITPFLGVHEGRCDLSRYVSKYENPTIPLKSLAALSRYDHLIAYFTGFSYFLPRHKVSPDFVRALILAESRGNPRAVSEKNAIGLGQILLPTGRQAAAELARSRTVFHYVQRERLADLTAEDLHDPAVNILLTCYLVAKYNYRFNGKLDLVISAWNAGEHTDSLAFGKYADYEETKNLIGRVNGYYMFFLKKR